MGERLIAKGEFKWGRLWGNVWVNDREISIGEKSFEFELLIVEGEKQYLHDSYLD